LKVVSLPPVVVKLIAIRNPITSKNVCWSRSGMSILSDLRCLTLWYFLMVIQRYSEKPIPRESPCLPGLKYKPKCTICRIKIEYSYDVLDFR
jgi:hypothetical protein